MPSGRDSFRRNRVAPFVLLYFTTSGRDTSVAPVSNSVTIVAKETEGSDESKAVREHGSVVSVPVAVKTLFRVVLFFQLKECCELRIAAFDLVSSGIAMVGQIVRASVACCHVDEPTKGKLRTLKPFRAVNRM